MCFGQMQQYVVPNAELTKLLKLLKIVGFINFAVAFLRIIIGDFMSMIYDLINVFILYSAYKSVFFICMAMYILFSIFTSFYIFIAVATFVQGKMQGVITGNSGYVGFGIYLFIFCFYIFAIIAAFECYREMKGQFLGVGSSDISGILSSLT